MSYEFNKSRYYSDKKDSREETGLKLLKSGTWMEIRVPIVYCMFPDAANNLEEILEQMRSFGIERVIDFRDANGFIQYESDFLIEQFERLYQEAPWRMDLIEHEGEIEDTNYPIWFPVYFYEIHPDIMRILRDSRPSERTEIVQNKAFDTKIRSSWCQELKNATCCFVQYAEDIEILRLLFRGITPIDITP